MRTSAATALLPRATVGSRPRPAPRAEGGGHECSHPVSVARPGPGGLARPDDLPRDPGDAVCLGPVLGVQVPVEPDLYARRGRRPLRQQRVDLRRSRRRGRPQERLGDHPGPDPRLRPRLPVRARPAHRRLVADPGADGLRPRRAGRVRHLRGDRRGHGGGRLAVRRHAEHRHGLRLRLPARPGRPGQLGDRPEDRARRRHRVLDLRGVGGPEGRHAARGRARGRHRGHRRRGRLPVRARSGRARQLGSGPQAGGRRRSGRGQPRNERGPVRAPRAGGAGRCPQRRRRPGRLRSGLRLPQVPGRHRPLGRDGQADSLGPPWPTDTSAAR